MSFLVTLYSYVPDARAIKVAGTWNVNDLVIVRSEIPVTSNLGSL